MRAATRIGVMLWCVAAAAAAQADTVYRCGNGEYRSTPCPGGVPIDAADDRTAEQRIEAQAAARREAALAARLSAERRERERQTKPARAASLGAPASAPSAPASASKKHGAKHKKHPPPANPRMSAPMRAPPSSDGKR